MTSDLIVAPIRGQVAEILNSREVVINRGIRHGVRIGMKFAILNPRGESIIDPETGEDLGSVHRPKIEVRVISVQDRLAVAQTFKATRVNVGGMGLGATAGVSSLGKLFDPPKYIKVYESFKADQAAWEVIDEDDSFVKVGDPVEQIVDLPAEEALEA